MAEALWMLNGNNNLDYLLWFNSKFGEYSDDGETLHGAYGHRWRQYFGYDQLEWIIDELTNNPASRRCVLQM
ncbi:thymidylate synthase, partial [Streptomyces caeruleatus]